MPQAHYGTWDSSITPQALAANGKRFFDTVADGDFIYNVEMRPNEKARYVIVRYSKDGTATDMIAAPFSARTRVHEYGGRAFTVQNGVIYFVNFADQFLYTVKVGEAPVVLNNTGVRFAEPVMTKHGLIAVAEKHHISEDGKTEVKEATNFIALINPETGAMETLIGGHDFYAFPTVSADGNKIAWICWDHPNMPWDETELWVADLVDGNVENAQRIGAEDPTVVSHFQPGWDQHNNLIFMSDKSNWWNPYHWNAVTGAITPIVTMEEDLGVPLWNLGLTTWGFYDSYQIFTFDKNNKVAFMLVDPNVPEHPHIFESGFNSVSRLCIHKGHLYFVGASGTEPPALVKFSVSGGVQYLARSMDVALLWDAISVAEHIEFPTKSRQGKAYAYYYPPKNPEFFAPGGEKPPVVIMIHGGPTASASPGFDLAKQFWTSRGFAVADVNYGGSTGYGRKYRKALQRDKADEPGYWGQMDIADCVACVNYLVEKGLVDPNKVVIRGGSAGGYTTLAALAFTDTFKAGTSLYGVSDILVLAKETHKFESRYMDQLVGSLPQFEATYHERSPIHHLVGIRSPLLVLQGDEDKIVLPNQAEMMVEGLKALGRTVEYVLYAGEQHGFRKAETIIDAYERELAFYRKVFGLTQEVMAEAKKAPSPSSSPRRAPTP